LKLSRTALILAILTLLVFGSSVWNVRSGAWPFAVGFQVVAIGCALGLFSVMVSFGGLLSRHRRGQAVPLAIAFVLTIAALALPLNALYRASVTPMIHDISTDLEHPPAFMAVAPLRESGQNPITYGGPEVAAAQRTAYPDIQPLLINMAPSEAFERALAQARAMGWEIVAFDAEEARIEATDTTFWFRFKDDIVIRITPDGARSRIDLRSMSRIGKGDIGANAKRIRAYLDGLSD